jgi:hypothetical protein
LSTGEIKHNVHRKRTSWGRAWRAPALIVVVVAIALGLAACGGGSPRASSRASNSTAPATLSGVAPRSSPSDANSSQYLEFAYCTQAHGVNIPESPPQGNISSNGDSAVYLGNNFTPNAPQVQAAERGCAKYAGAQTVAPGLQAQVLKEQLNYAQCVRSHGVSGFPDPSSNGGFTIPSSVDQNSSTFQSAENACKALLPSVSDNSGS